MSYAGIRTAAMGPIAGRLLMLALAAGLATPALADRTGQVRAVHAEEQEIVIDGRAYRLAPDLVPRYAGSDRLADLGSLRPGMPVEYETGSGGTIVRLVLLADE